MSIKRVLLTGGAGFIGHHTLHYLLEHTDADIVVVDRRAHAPVPSARLREIGALDHARVQILEADFGHELSPDLLRELGAVTHVIHMGAQSQVDSSIADPALSIRSNITGTLVLLQWARTLASLQLFLYFSTNEVFGPSPDGVTYTEGDRHNPPNPYAATKSAAENLCVAYANTYRLPIIITNTMNVFGERQPREKFLPKCVRTVLADDSMTIHGAPGGKSGSRFYIHVGAVADAVLWLLRHVTAPEDMLSIADAARGRYNIVGETEVTNLDFAQRVAKVLGKEIKYTVVDSASLRPGYDFRYALDGSKLARCGWRYPKTFDESLRESALWMADPQNRRWLEAM
jgi:dTDP-D-glucose 4,6-dehydratase